MVEAMTDLYQLDAERGYIYYGRFSQSRDGWAWQTGVRARAAWTCDTLGDLSDQ